MSTVTFAYPTHLYSLNIPYYIIKELFLFYRGATVAYAAYTLLVITLFTSALITDSGKQCDKPLRTYAIVEIITQAVAFALFVCVHHYNGCDPVQPNQDVIAMTYVLLVVYTALWVTN